MAQTEITVQIFDDIDNVKNVLIKKGFLYDDTLTGKDRFFSILSKEEVKKSSFKALMDNSIIVREFNQAKINKRQTLMVHKQKTFDDEGKVISENKTSLKIEDGLTASNLLINAGLNNWLNLEQKNHFFKKDEITVILGIVNGLEGCFIEIEEYPSIKDKSFEEKYKALVDIVNSLGIVVGNDYSVIKSKMLYNKQNLQKTMENS